MLDGTGLQNDDPWSHGTTKQTKRHLATETDQFIKRVTVSHLHNNNDTAAERANKVKEGRGEEDVEVRSASAHCASHGASFPQVHIDGVEVRLQKSVVVGQ